MSRDDLDGIASELTELIDAVDNEQVRERLAAVTRRLERRTERSATAGVQLTPREADVLVQVARGLTNQQVANNLGLLPNTVKSYLKTAMRKLDATNRVQAIANARAAGLRL